MNEIAFAMKNDEAISTRLNADSKHEFVDPKAVSYHYFVKYILKKVIGYCSQEPPHDFVDVPVTQGICSVLGINPTGIKTWDFAFVSRIVRPFLDAYAIDDICANSDMRSKLRAIKNDSESAMGVVFQ